MVTPLTGAGWVRAALGAADDALARQGRATLDTAEDALGEY